MTPLSIKLELEPGAWADAGELLNGTLAEVGVVPTGTESGKPAVGFRIELEDGRTVGAWTTLALFQAAAIAIAARYGDPRDSLDDDDRARAAEAVEKALRELGREGAS